MYKGTTQGGAGILGSWGRVYSRKGHVGRVAGHGGEGEEGEELIHSQFKKNPTKLTFLVHSQLILVRFKIYRFAGV